MSAQSIKEQGPKTLDKARKRIAIAQAREGRPVLVDSPADAVEMAAIKRRVADLTSDGTPLFAGVVADVENDGNRGPKPPRTLTASDLEAADRALLEHRMQELLAKSSWPEVRVLSAMLDQLPVSRLVLACETQMLGDVCAADARNDFKRTTTAMMTAQGSLLRTIDAWEVVMLAVEERRKKRTVGDYTSGKVAREHAAELPAKAGAR